MGTNAVSIEYRRREPGILSWLINTEVGRATTGRTKLVLTAIHIPNIASHTDQVEVGPGEPATVTSLPAPTTSQTAVPGLSSSQARFWSEVRKDHRNKARKIAAIVGGVIGGIVLVAALVTMLLWRARIRRRRTTRAASAIIFPNRRGSSMQMKESISEPINGPFDIPPETI